MLKESSTICLELYLGLNTAVMHEVLDGFEVVGVGVSSSGIISSFISCFMSMDTIGSLFPKSSSS